MGEDHENGPSEEQPPPLPPRPSMESNDSIDSRMAMAAATTAITPLDIQTLSFPDGSRGTFSTTGSRAASTPVQSSSGQATPTRTLGEGEDSMSIASFSPTLRPPNDIASLLMGEFNKRSPAWNLLRSQSATVPPFETLRMDNTTRNLAGFEHEFDDLPDEADASFKDEDRVTMWKAKLKHYMILSSAGKPIYSRHGDLGLINSSMGVIQTLISFYEGAKNPLSGFTAGTTRFVVATQGPLYFVAISRLGESDSQLRAQLEALYMQILSTLTLPTLKNIFVPRQHCLVPWECLKLRKSQRHAINNAFLKQRTDKLLYGLIVAGGKLVSVIRPRRHSLHPSDLQLIFNMLFFDGVDGEQATGQEAPVHKDEELAIILISPDKESFFELKQMRDNVAASLAKSGHLSLIQTAARAGRPKTTDIAPGGQISHFLYKSRANVQFSMSALDPVFSSLMARRRLMGLYHQLHAAVHAKHSHMRVLHSVSEDATSLAWITPIFEFYCVAGPNVSRAVLTQGANKVIQWARREEERVFIIGGGVF
ncbi:Vacuolar fusion protein mon1 [Colletotrichum fioriniae]|uniref:Vacuolar fusion protein mon1 n=1 Tax=Colletotrichum fioriniae TaxID=710243 RepID=UPI0032DB6325|nr:Vacuolar fusion protein mon1 [Colletotrichum fioriniae]